MAQGGSGHMPKRSWGKGCKKCYVPCWDCLNDNPEPEGEHDEFGPLNSKTVDKRRQARLDGKLIDF